MPHPTDHHITWARVQPARHRHSLAPSEVDPPDLEALGLPSQTALPRSADGLQAELERVLGAAWSAPGGRVALTAGGSEANAIVFGALLERGDEVLVETPGYEPHREVPRLFDVAVRRFERPVWDGGLPLAAAVEAALGPATRMVVVTHLHNPSGVALTGGDARALGDLAERHGLWVLCDEIFRDALDEPRGTFAALGPRWVATSSLTKVYGLGGLRLGWIAGSDDVLSRCARVQNALSASPSVPSIALALALAPHLDTLRARTHRILAANHTRWAALLRDDVPFTSPARPRGTTAWALFPFDDGGDAFAAFASRHADLAVTPGRFFADPRGIRVGLGGEPERFAPALDALRHALSAFVAGEPIRETPQEIP
jgi:aspartate/methionine/tyrosine aminotransferase